MLGYDYEIIYKRGKDNVVANALSRQYGDEGSLLALSTPIPDYWKKHAKNGSRIPPPLNSLETFKMTLTPHRVTHGLTTPSSIKVI